MTTSDVFLLWYHSKTVLSPIYINCILPCCYGSETPDVATIYFETILQKNVMGLMGF